MSNEPEKVFDEEEFSAAEEAALKSDGEYVHKFHTPFEWMGEKYDSITFKFGTLKGKTIVAIDKQLLRKGVTVASRAFNADFRIQYAANVSEPRIGADAIENMSDKDYLKIDAKVRNFLLKSEL